MLKKTRKMGINETSRINGRLANKNHIQQFDQRYKTSNNEQKRENEQNEADRALGHARRPKKKPARLVEESARTHLAYHCDGRWAGEVTTRQLLDDVLVELNDQAGDGLCDLVEKVDLGTAAAAVFTGQNTRNNFQIAAYVLDWEQNESGQDVENVVHDGVRKGSLKAIAVILLLKTSIIDYCPAISWKFAAEFQKELFLVGELIYKLCSE